MSYAELFEVPDPNPGTDPAVCGGSGLGSGVPSGA